MRRESSRLFLTGKPTPAEASAAGSHKLPAAGAGRAELVAGDTDEDPTLRTPRGFRFNRPLQGRDAAERSRPGNREIQLGNLDRQFFRSEERRVGKECRFRWCLYH